MSDEELPNLEQMKRAMADHDAGKWKTPAEIIAELDDNPLTDREKTILDAVRWHREEANALRAENAELRAKIDEQDHALAESFHDAQLWRHIVANGITVHDDGVAGVGKVHGRLQYDEGDPDVGIGAVAYWVIEKIEHLPDQRLANENAELRRDAGRWRFLRTFAGGPGPDWPDPETPEHMDSIIDAAIAKGATPCSAT